MIKKINKTTLDKVVSEAKNSKRLRKNLNYHISYDDSINRMLNAVEPGSYVQPHKHENPDKREIFLLLKGKMLVVFFNEEGEIAEHTLLDNQNNFGVEIPPNVWHTIISLEPGTVVYEIKDGPYSPIDDKNFASWAPKEGDIECGNFIKHILSSLNL